jgi:hypothetical protein
MQFSSDSNAVTSSSSHSAPLPPSLSADILTPATPGKRKRGKSLSRRTGQDGHIEKSGRWFVVRFWKDVPGQDNRMHVRERICPISGPGLLSKSERKRKAREIIQASGADSAEYFKEVVKQDTGVTFREQSKAWLQQSLTRKRKTNSGNFVFRCFRATWLRKQKTPEDLIRLWLGYGGTSVTDLYVNIEKEKAWRKEEAERVGVGFTLPTSVVPNVPKIQQDRVVEIAA